jgi:hypothetical protein
MPFAPAAFPTAPAVTELTTALAEVGIAAEAPIPVTIDGASSSLKARPGSAISAS